MKPPTAAKLILFHQPIPKQPHSGLFLLFFISFFTFAFLFTVLYTPTPTTPSPSLTPAIPSAISAALLHYASANASLTSPHLALPELSIVVSALRSCSPACNLLVFGITHESLLYVSLNHAGLTVFFDESETLANRLEREFPPGTRVEAYDVTYTTKVSQLGRLLRTARDEIAGECRPVQNLLFSDCPVALNDLPNHVYDVPWDAILIDGPRGYDEDSTGRMAVVFTAAVLARSKARSREREGVATATEVMVHECEREVEMVSSEEFLCEENLVEKFGGMARFSVPTAEVGSEAFCLHRANETASFEDDD